MQAQTIHEVIQLLESIIQRAYSQSSSLGIFPALYLRVTQKVKEGIDKGIFENGNRMEELDVRFANRYLEAYAQMEQHQSPTKSWDLAFKAAASSKPIILQHLMLGINAHINLDLGIAAAETCPGQQIHELEADFGKINEILFGLIEQVQHELDQLSPLLFVIDWIHGKNDERFAAFNLKLTRHHAWKMAKDYAMLSTDEERAQFIRKKDKRIALTGKILLKPPFILGWAVFFIRLLENKKIETILDVLTNRGAST
jgi:hypothetical protein